MVEYALSRVEISTGHRTVDLNRLKSAIQYEFTDKGIDAHVVKVKKVRGPHDDVFVIYSNVAGEASSPLLIDPLTAKMIIVAALAALGIGIVITVNLWMLNNRMPEFHPYADLKDLIHDILDGKSFRTIPSMIEYLKENHPEWYPGKSFCDVCGMAFDSAERMRAHRIACPDIEPIIPRGPGIIPKPKDWTPGAIITGMVNWFRKMLGRT